MVKLTDDTVTRWLKCPQQRKKVNQMHHHHHHHHRLESTHAINSHGLINVISQPNGVA